MDAGWLCLDCSERWRISGYKSGPWRYHRDLAYCSTWWAPSGLSTAVFMMSRRASLAQVHSPSDLQWIRWSMAASVISSQSDKLRSCRSGLQSPSTPKHSSVILVSLTSNLWTRFIVLNIISHSLFLKRFVDKSISVRFWHRWNKCTFGGCRFGGTLRCARAQRRILKVIRLSLHPNRSTQVCSWTSEYFNKWVWISSSRMVGRFCISGIWFLCWLISSEITWMHRHFKVVSFEKGGMATTETKRKKLIRINCLKIRNNLSGAEWLWDEPSLAHTVISW